MTNPIRAKPATRDFLKFLAQNPAIRSQIRAARDKTLIYSGTFFTAAFKEIQARKLVEPQFADKEILTDVLARVYVPTNLFPNASKPLPNLLAYVEDLQKQFPDPRPPSPPDPDRFMIWRVLSGIFAANAEGKVSFLIQSGVDETKVFVATELKVLLRNPKLHPDVKDLLEYYLRCVQDKNTHMNVGLLWA